MVQLFQNGRLVYCAWRSSIVKALSIYSFPLLIRFVDGKDRCFWIVFLHGLSFRSELEDAGMILSGTQIRKEIGKTIFISPFSESNLNSNSYNLRLGSRLIVYNDNVLDFKKKYSNENMTEVIIPPEGIILQPNRLYLGSTIERTHTNNYIPIIEGRSSVARLGLFVHVTAGLGEAGFNGHWTLELTCVQPIRIYSGYSICQIYFNTVLGTIDQCKSQKYQFSTEAQPSKLFKELTMEVN